MERKEDTPIRVSRRKYEEVHREKRHQLFNETEIYTKVKDSVPTKYGWWYTWIINYSKYRR